MNLPAYLYRTEPKKYLESIKRYGFKCGEANRLNLDVYGISTPTESEYATEKNWRVPDKNIILSPRIYVFLEFEIALANNLGRSNLVIRFPSTLPTLSNPDLYFSDGGFQRFMYAAYIVFPNHSVGDVVIKTHEIDVLINQQEWINLCNLDVSPEVLDKTK